VSIALLVCVGVVAVLGFGELFSDTPPQVQNQAQQNIQDDTQNRPQAQTLSINFYFRDADGRWGSEQRQLEPMDDNTDIVSAILQGILDGPQTEAFLPSIPDGVHIEGARIRTSIENTLLVTFSRSFADIDPIDMTLAISSLVYTLTELDFIDQLEFYIGEEPMLDGQGNTFGLRSRENTSLAETVPSWIADTATVILYFPDEQMMGLVGEIRVIEVNRQEDIWSFILDALIEGPVSPDLYPAIPIETTFVLGELMGDTISVSFGHDFYDALSSGGSADESFMVYSLVNTLTTLPEIRRVQIFIDGQPIQPDEEGNLHMDLSGPIERNESLIIGYMD